MKNLALPEAACYNRAGQVEAYAGEVFAIKE